MNEQICDPLNWDDERQYDRGKILNEQQLDEIEKYGRYQDIDGDEFLIEHTPEHTQVKEVISRGGSSHDANAAYTEDGDIYAEIMDRISLKFETALNYIPEPEISSLGSNTRGVIYLGTTTSAIKETLIIFRKRHIPRHNEIKRISIS